MKLTRKVAIDRTIELWAWLAETGRVKKGWGGWKKYGKMMHGCPLCEYTRKDEWANCRGCPYYQIFGLCILLHLPFAGWIRATTPKERKKHGKEFLAQMYEVRDEKG